MKEEVKCCFCGSSHVLGGPDNSSQSVCAVCLKQVELSLKPASLPCSCLSQSGLIPVEFNGQQYVFCPAHLPLSVGIVLARHLTSTYRYINAPTLFGTENNFRLLQVMGNKDPFGIGKLVPSEVSNLTADLKLLKHVISGFINPQFVVTSY